MLWSASYFGVRFLLAGSPSSPPPPPTNGGTPVAVNDVGYEFEEQTHVLKMRRAA